MIQDAGCLVVDEEDQVEPQMFGQVASFYYLKHQTMAVFAKNLSAGLGVPKVSLADPRAVLLAPAPMTVCCTGGQSVAFCMGDPQVVLLTRQISNVAARLGKAVDFSCVLQPFACYAS